MFVRNCFKATKSGNAFTLFIAHICLTDVRCLTQSLRSRTSFVLLNVTSLTVNVWHGCKSTAASRKAALYGAQAIKDR